MNFGQLRFVRAVADTGSFTGAAARCYVTQSTLSTGIARLEKELGGSAVGRGSLGELGEDGIGVRDRGGLDAVEELTTGGRCQ